MLETDFGHRSLPGPAPKRPRKNSEEDGATPPPSAKPLKSLHARSSSSSLARVAKQVEAATSSPTSSKKPTSTASIRSAKLPPSRYVDSCCWLMFSAHWWMIGAEKHLTLSLTTTRPFRRQSQTQQLASPLSVVLKTNVWRISKTNRILGSWRIIGLSARDVASSSRLARSRNILFALGKITENAAIRWL